MPVRFSKRPLTLFLAVQLTLLTTFGVSFARNSTDTTRQLEQFSHGRMEYPPLKITRETPLRITPFYDDPDLVSDEDLAAVLRQVMPRFPAQRIKPNYVEHALRIWGVDAEFRDQHAMSGKKMLDFLVNHGQYLASWGDKIQPLLQEDEDAGVSIRYGREEGASVHHDHWLACLTEAGVSLHEPIYVPSHRQHTIEDALQQALRDFRLDERETEWSALAYGLWLPPQHNWINDQGRTITFDLLAERLMRGALEQGVCHGTHRLYSLMVLVRLDDEYHGELLRKETRAAILAHLAHIRDIIIKSQFPDGHWGSNWPEGEDSVKHPLEDEEYRKVIATGHQLEWLAIAPPDLHPPRAQIHKAAQWLIATTKRQKSSEILAKYTFFSHVGNALALWRKTSPTAFWHEWEASHPQEGLDAPPVEAPAVTEKAMH